MPWFLNLKEIILGSRVEDEPPPEKRHVPRVSCFIEANFITEDKSSFEGHITVIELTGMRIVTPIKIVNGQKLIASVDNFSGVLMARPYSVENVNAEVIWCKKKKGFSQYVAGIRFTDCPEMIKKSWVRFVLDSFGVKDSAGFQRRKQIRVPTMLPVSCHYGKKKSAQGVAYDMSIDGLRMSLKSDLVTGTEVMLHIGPYKRLPVLQCRGKIRRSNYDPGNDAFTMGVEFTELDDRQIKQIGSYIKTLLKESSI